MALDEVEKQSAFILSLLIWSDDFELSSNSFIKTLFGYTLLPIALICLLVYNLKIYAVSAEITKSTIMMKMVSLLKKSLVSEMANGCILANTKKNILCNRNFGDVFRTS